MGRYVIDASVVLQLLSEGRQGSTRHELLAPTLLRSEILETLYRTVGSGSLPESEGLDRLARFARMKIRYLGDKVLRRQAWSVAQRLGWGSTRAAEYVALTELQADAFVTLDASLAAAASRIVPVAMADEVFAAVGAPH